jgi:hypothetical protein
MQAGRSISNPTFDASAVEPYTQRLDRDSRWALTEGSIFFEGGGAVQKTLRDITRRLDEIGVPYAVVGGMALFQHGHRRFTEDVDLLVTPESLKVIHDRLDGLGYVPPFTGSKNLRDAASGVKIEFLVTGGYPGDGKPKPVSYPDPSAVSFVADGIRYVRLSTFVELKLASAMTGGIGRMKDFTDVIELIKSASLEQNLADQLNPYVRGKYLELWDGVQQSPSNENG